MGRLAVDCFCEQVKLFNNSFCRSVRTARHRLDSLAALHWVARQHLWALLPDAGFHNIRAGAPESVASRLAWERTQDVFAFNTPAWRRAVCVQPGSDRFTPVQR